MDIFPIWKTTYYTTSDESVTFRILKWGTEEIYRARASRYPDENILRINLNKPCQNTLDSKMIPSTGLTDSVERSNAYAEYELQSLDGNDNWVTIYSFAFFNDWSYDPQAPAENLSEPINGHAAPDQLIPESLIVTGETFWECYEYEGGIEPDYASMYLTLEIESGGTLGFTSLGRWIEYSTDNGETWTLIPARSEMFGEFNRGDRILLRGEITGQNQTYYNSLLGGTATFRAFGNIMSLIYRDNFIGKTNLVTGHVLEYSIFPHSNITRADKLVLPADTLTEHCYCQMFMRCEKLRRAPQLPATTLARNCYTDMFFGCTSLTHAPQLPATTLANSCYVDMFFGCTSLITPPRLPASQLASLCYFEMFGNCTSLVTPPQLQERRLETNCYENMFFGCTSLTTAPELPATTLTRNCYAHMFEGCTSLIKAPELPARSLVGWCYNHMFEGCEKLNYVKCLATYIPEYDGEYLASCTTGWLQGVSGTGEFIKDSRMSRWTTGVNGIPAGWSVTDA